MPEEVSIAILCKEMGWDYYTYLRQPSWFVRIFRMMKKIEYEEAEIKKKLNG